MTQPTAVQRKEIEERRRIKELQTNCTHELLHVVPGTALWKCYNCGLARKDFSKEK